MIQKNISAIIDMKKNKSKLVVLTCYDANMSKLLSNLDVDILLVGDSVGMVKLGYSNTLSVTIEDMIHHTKAVKRGNTGNKLIVADMPYMTYENNPQEAVINAKKLIDAGADAVKVEGGQEILPSIKEILSANISVMGHLGLMPQSVEKIGGFKVQCRDEQSAQKLLEDSIILQQAGVFSIVLECIPQMVAKNVTEKLDISTISCGAGRYCDGQVLVLDDMLGMFSDFTPKFVKKYANLAQTIKDAVELYSKEVRTEKFPEEGNTYK
ncbi:MAG: 3-methyl-2-oxobutanoate hydroxymethyltransferase [Endomicrobiaceae bacterium]|nr:3-methyl-2-oxobutanoate hydroxymethyltransferase [Endomicrobiaceae bacterium]